MARIRADYVFGTTTVALASGDTTLSSSALARLPAVTSPDVAAITLHDATTGTYEIVHVTAHTAAATAATILRGREGSTAQSWGSGSAWLHGPTAQDFASSGGSGPLPKVVELASNQSITSTTYTTILSTTFTPTGTCAIITIAGAGTHSTANQIAIFQVLRDGTGTLTKSFGSPHQATNIVVQSAIAGSRKFTDLTPGQTYTFSLQVRVSTGTWFCRPVSFPENDQLTMKVEDGSPL